MKRCHYNLISSIVVIDVAIAFTYIKLLRMIV